MVGFAQTTADPPLSVKFVSAGMAGCIGDMITFPLDVAKVRLQIQGEGAATSAASQAVHHLSPGTAAAAPAFKYKGMVGTLLTISREEGPRALYNGIIPGLQRQVCFCSIRIGMYDVVKGAYISAFNRGGMAVMCAQPTDVVKVRMQAQTGGPRYRGSIDAYKTIARTEGVKGLWKGVIPNVTRNAIVNATELVSYDLIKEAILHYRLLSDNMPCHFVSAFGAGFCTTVMASPVDVVKTRYMNSPPGVYNGAVNCAIKMYKEGGPMAFYKGFVPSFIRLGSWNIVMFVCFEQLKRGFMQMSYFQPEIKSTQPQPFVHCRMDL